MDDPPVPRYSVVIPVWNEQTSIECCLTSLRGQTYNGAVELIVVDNGSSDRTAELARSLGARVVDEPRRGVIWARQRGYLAAAGEIVVTTDADTTFDPGWLERIDRAWTTHPQAALVAGPCRFVDGPRWAGLVDRLVFGTVDLFRRRTGRVFYVTATNLSYRRADFDGYDTALTQGGDEVAVLHAQRDRGEVIWLPDNPTFTSGRRLERGLGYSVFVSFGYYYVGGYVLNRLFGRTTIGMAPPFRRPSNGGAHRPRLGGRAARMDRGASNSGSIDQNGQRAEHSDRGED